MGLGHSPRIITDGMVLCLDAANPRNFNLTAVEVLVVAGGGGGGMDMGGGGGAGGVIYNSNFAVTPGTQLTVTVGNGGVGAPAAGTNGQPGGHQYTIPATQGGNSVFGALTAIGGGFGGSSYRGYTPGIAGGSGGSGGGASGYNDNAGTFLGGLGTSGQGNRGGNSTAAYYSGGGGGAGAPGADSTNQPNGGVGVENSILGVSYFWGGGGGGASYSLSTGGNGGNGGGGGGAVGTTVGGSGLNSGSPGGGGSPNSQTNTPGGNAGANTGGGGGGGSHYNANNKGGDGGSGIVIVRYPGPQKAIGGTVTSVGGDTIHTFTTSGNFTPLVNTNASAVLGLSDLSGNRNFGTTAGSPTYNSANGGSLYFEGSDEWFSTTLSIGDANTSFSWGGFVKVNSSTSSNFFLFGNYTENSTTPFFAITFNNSGDNTFIYIRDSTGGTAISSGNTNLDLSTWYYLIGVRDAGANQVKLYVNGELVDTDTFAGSHNVKSTTNNFGGVRHLTNYANCNIGNVHVYNRALTATEVSQNFNALRGRYGL